MSSTAQYPKTEYTHRVVKVDKVALEGISGSKLRVAIHKETREVHRLVEDNWSEESKAMLSQIYTEKEGKFYNLPKAKKAKATNCLLYTSPSPRDS